MRHIATKRPNGQKMTTSISQSISSITNNSIRSMRSQLLNTTLKRLMNRSLTLLKKLPNVRNNDTINIRNSKISRSAKNKFIIIKISPQVSNMRRQRLLTKVTPNRRTTINTMMQKERNTNTRRLNSTNHRLLAINPTNTLNIRRNILHYTPNSTTEINNILRPTMKIKRQITIRIISRIRTLNIKVNKQNQQHRVPALTAPNRIREVTTVSYAPHP